MVMTLPKPAFCGFTLLKDVIAERQNGKNAKFFNGIAADWKAELGKYEKYKGSPEFIKPWVTIEPHAGKFLNLYLSPQKDSAQRKVLRKLRDHGLNNCPACGELGQPGTLDHYLPKQLYPHFCITPLNLYPMCDSCQRAKGDKTGDALSPRFFLHPYYDTFCAEQVLQIEITAPFDAPTFTLSVVPTLTRVQRKLVSRHVKELQIETRFSRYFRGQYRRLLRLVGELRQKKLPIKASLAAFQISASTDSSNAWDHVFYAGVLSNEELIGYLETEQLPDFL